MNDTALQNFQLAVAIRSSLVRLSQSSAGSEYLTRRINEATKDVDRAKLGLRTAAASGFVNPR